MTKEMKIVVRGDEPCDATMYLSKDAVGNITIVMSQSGVTQMEMHLKCMGGTHPGVFARFSEMMEKMPIVERPYQPIRS